jgi:methylphosphotriester-DNA--protein-cysteine methyltransferase
MIAAVTVGALLLLSRKRPCAQEDEPSYVGNETTGVFHRAGCRFFELADLSPVFSTRDQALAADYRPCGICKP